MKQELTLAQEWDKVFPLSEKVNHKKVTFETQYGLTLAADLYTPKNAEGKQPAIAVSGPFGATKEQSSGLYAMRMAERGYVTLAFDPSYTGESSGEPRRTASPDINTEDFMAAVDYLSQQENVDAEKIGIIGICGWGGIDSEDKEESRHAAREALSKQRLTDPISMLLDYLIKKETGLTAQRYIQNKVIDLSKQYVMDKELTINQVAYKLGFQYPQHFTRLFKQQVGVTPTEYRN